MKEKEGPAGLKRGAERCHLEKDFGISQRIEAAVLGRQSPGKRGNVKKKKRGKKQQSDSLTGSAAAGGTPTDMAK